MARVWAKDVREAHASCVPLPEEFVSGGVLCGDHAMWARLDSCAWERLEH